MLGPRDVEILKHSAKIGMKDARTEEDLEGSASNDHDVIQPTVPIIKLSLKEVNPFKPLVLVLRRWNNLVILLASGKSQGIRVCNMLIYVSTRSFIRIFIFDNVHICEDIRLTV
jgi:hypothetical protein